MKPPDQPDAIKAGKILQRLLEAGVGEKFEHVPRLSCILRLVGRMKFERLGGRNETNRLERER
jgi:hypothetical protein